MLISKFIGLKCISCVEECFFCIEWWVDKLKSRQGYRILNRSSSSLSINDVDLVDCRFWTFISPIRHLQFSSLLVLILCIIVHQFLHLIHIKSVLGLILLTVFSPCKLYLGEQKSEVFKGNIVFIRPLKG